MTASQATPGSSEAPIVIKEYDRPASLDNPRSPRKPKRGNFEKNAWLFMRFSGLALIILTIGHMFIMLAWDNGVHRIDASFVAARWKEPFWQIWDLTMLWLAQLHGGNGVRTVIADYSRKDSTRFWLNVLLAVSMILVLVLGTYALLTFDTSSVNN
ncbi:succinate dehydrogenase hydrophobic membrane anchor subunit [Gordonia sp. TBRC 11910]|uniref:Succinate dehydrogenase hydrophobic membrane anchor subunit n=1 Tax=Gordonia asplenii TaxID=2725283 RepID=A0A848KRK1_9ACTN|nr:succinate dehydrogenase hydrophobic membrane anchor subunit [Gordonia asplenii]NMO01040.1 succinate dehydrogenase hydrophobic membrane anchor subunit [Gordonia asplenii]